MKKEDVMVKGSTYLLSLQKIFGKKAVDVHGYISNDFGEPVFQLCRILFEDGTWAGVEGEHDCPYLSEKLPEGLND